MKMTSRVGRPPHVRELNEEGTEFGVNVGGVQHTFRAGDDGRIRAVGSIARDSARTEDRAFAKSRVMAHIAAATDIEEAVNEDLDE